jgi:signal transduction histidine kinase
MPWPPETCEDGTMNAPLPRSTWQIPRIDKNDRWVGGVASAIAREIGVQALVIRVAFFALTLVVGWGLVLYVVAWAALSFLAPPQISPYSPVPKGATSLHRHLAIALIVGGMMALLGQVAPAAFTSITWPIGFVLTGALIAWSRGDDAEGISIVVRIIAGLSVAIGGILAFAALSDGDLIEIVIAFIFGLAVIAGVTLIAAPSVVQMARSLDGERIDRIRSDERARISAHLHDSVLQTLTLIQRHSDDPSRTAHLARQQERELRNWLYGPTTTEPDGVHLRPALEKAASEVEQTHNVQINVVAVGDTGAAVHGDLGRLIAATREAMSNAAVHSGVDQIDVFVERGPHAIDIFIRDTGIGFDPDEIDGDRRGVSGSIIARMERAGGLATIHSSPNSGTEVELHLPITPHPPSPGAEQTSPTSSEHAS